MLLNRHNDYELMTKGITPARRDTISMKCIERNIKIDDFSFEILHFGI